MDKPETCEWGECKEKPKQSTVLDGERYWFCGDDHQDEFWQHIQSSGNY